MRPFYPFLPVAYALLLCVSSIGQSISPFYVGAAGGSYSVDGVSLEIAVGELAIQTKESNGVILTEGNLQPRRPKLVIVAPSEACFQDSVRLTVSGGSRFTWSTEMNPEVVLSNDTVFNFVFEDTQAFLVQNNYSSSEVIRVELKPLNECGFELVVYEYISPNGDGDNDVFFIENIERSQDHEVIVYDKWGQEVYRNNHYENDWTANDLPDGTYVYVVRENDVAITYKGKLIIER